MGKILEVNNLKISFRTQGGTVKAVRDISFDIECQFRNVSKILSQ